MSYAILAAAITALILSIAGTATGKRSVRLSGQLLAVGVIAVILFGFLRG